MVFATYKGVVVDRINATGANGDVTMSPKLMTFNEFELSPLRRLQAKIVVSYRANMLSRQVCRIRDCFGNSGGRAVFENGTEAHLCFRRRRNHKVVTKALVDIKYTDQKMRGLMSKAAREQHPGIDKQLWCRGALVNASTGVSVAVLDMGYRLFEEEMMVAWECNPEGSRCSTVASSPGGHGCEPGTSSPVMMSSTLS